MERMINVAIGLTKKTAISFIVCVMFICLLGSVMNEQLVPISTLFQTDSIRYSTIFEIFSLSFIIGVINTVFDYPGFMKKTLFLYKLILRLVAIVFITVMYIYIFDWFPFTNIEAWIGFIITFGICSISALSISLYMTRKKDQEYQELLSDYKKRGKEHESDLY